MRATGILVLAWMSLCALPIEADTKVQIVVSGPEQKESVQTLYVTPESLRAGTGPREEMGFLIFHRANKTFYMVNPKDRSYMELNEASLAQIQGQMQGAQAQAMKELQARMKEMPPEQRKRMEQALSNMPGMQPQLQETPVTYQKTSQRETVNGYPCTRVDAFRGQTKVRELWVTSIDALAMPAADYQTLMAMQEMVKALASRLGSGSVPQLVEKELDGVPVRTVHFNNQGAVDSERELKSITHEALDPALFEIPEGYKKRDMPSFGNRPPNR